MVAGADLADAGEEIRLDLTAELGIAPFIIDDIESHTGGERQEAEVVDCIQILAQGRVVGFVPKLIFGHVEIQITRTGDTFAAVVGEVVTDEPIGFEMLLEV